MTAGGAVAGVGRAGRCGALLCAAGLAACNPGARVTHRAETTPPAPNGVAATSKGVTLSFVGLADLHGQLEALPAFGGVVHALQRALGPRGAVVVVDAGDMYQGTLASNVTEGKALAHAYNALGMTAAAVGNHELDYGPVGVPFEPSLWPASLDGLAVLEGSAAAKDALRDPQGAFKAFLDVAKFPLLSANLVFEESREPVRWGGLKATHLLDVHGVEVGLVGALTFETPQIVTSDAFAGLDVTPIAAALTQGAAELRARGAEVVVALVHAGGHCSRFDDPYDLSHCEGGELFPVVRALPLGAVDVVLGGHTHGGIAHYVDGVAVVQPYAHGRAFARVDVRVQPGHLHAGDVQTSKLETTIFPPQPLCRERGAPCEVAEYAGEKVTPDASVAEAIRPALEAARELRSKLLGVEVSSRFEARHSRETALGNLIADLTRAVAQADVALMNEGGIRADLPVGPLTYGKWFEVLPFDNRLVTVTLSAAELAEALRRNFVDPERGLIAVSGVRVQATCDVDGSLKIDVRLPNDAPVPAGKKLRVALSDYLATGGDGLLSHVADLDMRQVGTALYRDALARKLVERDGRVSADDPGLYDPKHPRVRLPGAHPVACR